MSRQSGAGVALSGELASTPIAQLLATLEASGRSAEVRLATEYGQGCIWFREGRLIDATIGATSGEEAASRLAGLEDGRFEVEYAAVTRPRVIESTVQRLLQQRAARRNEWKELMDRAPSLNAVLHVVAPAHPSLARHAELGRLFDGSRCVLDVIDLSGQDAVRALRDIATLVHEGVLAESHSLSRSPPAIVDPTAGDQEPEPGDLLLASPVASLTVTAEGSEPLDPVAILPVAEPREEAKPDPAETLSTTNDPLPAAEAALPAVDRPAADRPTADPGEPSAFANVVQAPLAAAQLFGSDASPATRRQFPGETLPTNPFSRTLPWTGAPPDAAAARGPFPKTLRDLPAAPKTTAGSTGSEPAALPGAAELPPPTADAGAAGPAPDAPARQGTASASEAPEPAKEAVKEAEPKKLRDRFVGRYEVLCRLGRGGMGTVYLCRVTGRAGFRRLFALKVLRRRVSEASDAEQRFLEEARVAARLHHPNVVAVVDAAVHGTQPYLVMDYVEGCSLHLLLSRNPGRRPPELLLSIIMDALNGLQAAHSLQDEQGGPAGVVHCDISPENILVGVEGIARISDFGVARASNGALSATDYPQTHGKASYVAPELAMGWELDQRADLFSLGVVFYNALTGLTLFQGATVEETLQNVLYQPILPPSQVGLRPPAYFDEVCLRALQRNREHRYQSAEDMLNDLRRVALEQRLVSLTSRVGAWVREVAQHELHMRRLASLDASRRSKSSPQAHHVSDLPRALVGAPAAEKPPAPPPVGLPPQDRPVDSAPPDTAAVRRPSRLRNMVLIAASVFALAAIAVTTLFPSTVGRWFQLDMGALPGAQVSDGPSGELDDVEPDEASPPADGPSVAPSAVPASVVPQRGP